MVEIAFVEAVMNVYPLLDIVSRPIKLVEVWNVCFNTVHFLQVHRAKHFWRYAEETAIIKF